MDLLCRDYEKPVPQYLGVSNLLSVILQSRMFQELLDIATKTEPKTTRKRK